MVALLMKVRRFEKVGGVPWKHQGEPCFCFLGYNSLLLTHHETSFNGQLCRYLYSLDQLL